MEVLCMIELYHGSNVAIKEIDLSKGRLGKDFGQGFYLSDDKLQAMRMAMLVSRREGYGEPTLTKFLFDESVFKTDQLNILTFDSYSKEWAEFVMLNRNNKSTIPVHDYDIVYGPIANDRVGLQIKRLEQGIQSSKEFLRNVRYIQSTFQYYFGTQRSLQYLRLL